MSVELSWSETRLAALAGVDRHLRALHLGRKPRYGQVSAERCWQDNIDGTLGEWVVAKALDRFWPGGAPELDTEGDIGDLQVRATARRDGCLIIHRGDLDDAPFVLVVGTPPTFDLPGWIKGRDGKRKEWWRKDVRNPAYFVPQSALRPLDELIGELS